MTSVPKFQDLGPDDAKAIQQVAKMVVAGFKELSPTAWPDLPSAYDEIRESFQADRLSRVATDRESSVLGWIGGIRQYEGRAWELHPLVVRTDCQRQGIGRALVADLATQVKSRGGVTLYLGTDDEVNWTSISGKDLYPDVLQKLMRIENLRGHPYEFYLKVGFQIVGVIPDANGLGKPDILMAKRIL